jgi:hypothetical protein
VTVSLECVVVVYEGVREGSARLENNVLQTEAQQETEYELEAIYLATWTVGVYEGLESGFISFDQHVLLLSTMIDLIFFIRK